jgi:beta-lactamase regulating signal transducer with metallopeptidase domain
VPFSQGGKAMEETRSLILTILMGSWVVITAVLAILVIYRGTLSSREDDQNFIDAAEQHHYREQQDIIARISSLTRPIIALAVVSGVLLMVSAGLWLYQGYKSF